MMTGAIPKTKDVAIQEKLDRAFRLLPERKYGDAEQLCLEALEAVPGHPPALFMLGAVYCFAEQYDKALPLLLQASALEPNNIPALYNIGVAYGGLKRDAEAMETYRRVLSREPKHPQTLNNLGTLLVNAGRPTEGLTHFRHLIEHHPNHPLVSINLVRAETNTLPMNDWSARCDAMLTGKAPLSAENRYLVLIHRATAEWMNNDPQALATSLWAASNTRPPTLTPRTVNQRKYETFLTRLMHHRGANPMLYTATGAPLFMVGDSHSLSYANTRLAWKGEDRTVTGHLIVGAKAWHVSSPEPNQYTSALDAHFDRLPEDVDLICGFGEIDCRMDGGILPYCKKTGQPLEKVVAEQVARYVASMQARAKPKKINLHFLSVPAPTANSGDRRDVVKLFNTTLKKEAEKSGSSHIDIYSTVADNNGYAQDSFRIDEYHMKPEVLSLATRE